MEAAVATNKVLLRLHEVTEITGLSKPTIYKYIRDIDHDFPHQVRLGPNRVAWVKVEIERWIKSRKDARHSEQQAA